MRKIAEIRQDMAAKISEVKALNPADAEAVKKGVEELEALQAELRAADAVEAAAQKLAEKRIDREERKAGEKFSFLKFVRGLVENNLTGVEAEVAKEGAEEYRRLGFNHQGTVIPSFILTRDASGQNAGVAADGGNLKEQLGIKYVEDLKAKLVVAQLGATVLTNLVGELPLVSGAEITAAWKAEGAQGSASKAAFAKVTMSPKRNFVKTAVTYDLLRQTSFDVEACLIEKMTAAHAALIEAAAINGTGADNQPKGILNTTGIGSVAMGTNGGAITWAKVVELESKINSENANRGKVAYLTNPKVWGALKTTEKASGTGRFIMEENAGMMLNGYKADFTSLVPSNLTKGTASGTCSALIMGNFEDLYIGEWGGLDIVVDKVTRADYGEVVLTINAYNDCAVAQPKSFAAIKDITIA